MALTGVYLALIGIIGVGLGLILRHTAAGIAVLVGVVFVLPILGLGHHVGRFLPEMIAANSLSAVKPIAAFTWSPWLELGIIAAYAIAVLAAGAYLFTSRDA